MSYREQAIEGMKYVNDNDTRTIAAAILSLADEEPVIGPVQAYRERSKLEVRTWALRISLGFNIALVSSIIVRVVS